MTTSLTDPVTASATVVTLDGWELVPKRDQATLTFTPESLLWAVFSFRDSTGKVLSTKRYESVLSQLPTSVKTPAKALHEALIAAAKQSGFIPPGTETPDF